MTLKSDAVPTPIRIEFNINYPALVKLTDFGRAKHKENWVSCYPGKKYEAPKEDSDGWSKWSLWELMAEFGKYFYNGAVEIPFETNIRLEEKW